MKDCGRQSCVEVDVQLEDQANRPPILASPLEVPLLASVVVINGATPVELSLLRPLIDSVALGHGVVEPASP
jgi:hypothetical protein